MKPEILCYVLVMIHRQCVCLTFILPIRLNIQEVWSIQVVANPIRHFLNRTKVKYVYFNNVSKQTCVNDTTII